MTELQIEQQLLMDFSSYLSGVGGALGLFAGMSILTLVQCCATFICLPFDKAYGKTQQKKSQANQPTVYLSKAQLYGHNQI